MKLRRVHFLVGLLGIVAFLSLFRGTVAAALGVGGRKTVADRIRQYGDAVHRRLQPRFRELGVSYPPKRIVLVGLKHEQKLEVWVAGSGRGELRQLVTYPILGASGDLGPKLRQGDNQVPEGLYRVESLNPNSHYHLSLRLDYPNTFDREKGKSDGRRRLGSDIMIHGGTASIGCLAMGDRAAEDLFVMVAEAGVETVSVVLSPVDFRVRNAPVATPGAPAWTSELYGQIKSQLLKLKRPPPPKVSP